MADAEVSTNSPLGSLWEGLSPHLIGTFFAVTKGPSPDDKSKVIWVRDMTQPEVRAPLSAGNMEVSLNWHSPFENVGVDQKLSSFSAMLQSGGFSSLLAQLQKSLPALSGMLDPVSAQTKTLEGKSNLTKLNSTQVFQGMPPIKLSVTAHFRAFKNSRTEVRDPLNQLVQWALPKKIAPDGILNGLAAGNVNAFASEVPQIIGLKYADMLLAPLVIESFPYELTGTRDSDGILTHASPAMTLGTLTALDVADWKDARSASALGRFNY